MIKWTVVGGISKTKAEELLAEAFDAMAPRDMLCVNLWRNGGEVFMAYASGFYSKMHGANCAEALAYKTRYADMWPKNCDQKYADLGVFWWEGPVEKRCSIFAYRLGDWEGWL